ncbi:type III-B CRISPR module-associated protein Cmr5 [Clostridium botulinum D/C]|uniref:type III-B CRISPR module-associated protein Cmr5 n=1 Tax=Clostridium botulinum TaxID=1491 RepID=UPI001E634738|nr:type III-B CRISPR module-associated protein Cmr5 [Clostridium botulinum]MCD3350624.1 type III-B CRISPR module-associated protein Cmr5 [Clostridium botulinum D/C]MCD3359644.1 type III-B CRISPR module-associated protein Cmr5 [Clostridium botulinum D/C]MCD3363152.1 type III-B CRISPR module-associated protein Cmr5 [Clostridium botulinum D/C]MCD3365341.1 type III-B CRISPR module-associated protein Cmr5 [Clostridium botulinum D/C]
MNKKEVEKYIPLAIISIKEVMSNTTNTAEESLELPKEFKGYISSFGAGIIQSGLLPTVAFFEKEDSNSKSYRFKITEMIFKMLAKEKYCKDNKLLNYLLDKEDIEEVKEDIINIAIALKLAMRTFKFSEKEKVGD